MSRRLLSRVFEPPERLRRGPLREGAFRSEHHTERNASILGITLGVTFTICFATGLLSHLIQHPPGWFSWPTRPAGLYRITQGLHVACGLASIPLLLIKLWVVYPRLWTWPPVREIAHVVERLALVPLVAGSLFLLFTGLANISLWYPWRFFFPAGHYWAAWITIGALIIHIGAKITLARASLRKRAPEQKAGGMTRRGFLGVTALATGVVTVTTIGQTVAPLRGLALLAPRRTDRGPQGFPVNKSAASARVTETAVSPSYRLSIEGAVARELSLSLQDLQGMSMRDAVLPIACVEGWSVSKRWRGIPVGQLLDLAGVSSDPEVEVSSLQETGLYRRSILLPEVVRDPDTLLALYVEGEPLHIDHGYPLRLIAPNRPGVMQTKWVTRLFVT